MIGLILQITYLTVLSFQALKHLFHACCHCAAVRPVSVGPDAADVGRGHPTPVSALRRRATASQPKSEN